VQVLSGLKMSLADHAVIKGQDSSTIAKMAGVIPAAWPISTVEKFHSRRKSSVSGEYVLPLGRNILRASEPSCHDWSSNTTSDSLLIPPGWLCAERTSGTVETITRMVAPFAASKEALFHRVIATSSVASASGTAVSA
jgi:hypothetical protein